VKENVSSVTCAEAEETREHSVKKIMATPDGSSMNALENQKINV
jgi:hypothetical protein